MRSEAGLRAVPRLLAAALAAVAAGAAAGQDLDVAYSYLSGDYGRGVETRFQEVRVGIEWGRAVRFRLVVPGVHGQVPRREVRAPEGVPADRVEAALSAGRVPDRFIVTTEGPRESGLGDLRLEAAVPLAGGGARRHRLDGELGVKAPTADEERNLGTGEWDARAGLSGEYALWNATLFGGVGWNHLGRPPGVEVRDVPDALLGIESEPLARGLRVAGWLEGHGAVSDRIGTRLAVAAGVGGSGRRAWRLVVRAGLTPDSERIAAEVGYRLRPGSLRGSRP
jgi:hypothetical protein